MPSIKKQLYLWKNHMLLGKSHQPLVAGWFRMLDGSYTLPSFPSGKGLPFPLPCFETPPLRTSMEVYIILPERAFLKKKKKIAHAT